jgi:hypothetical protein
MSDRKNMVQRRYDDPNKQRSVKRGAGEGKSEMESEGEGREAERIGAEEM